MIQNVIFGVFLLHAFFLQATHFFCLASLLLDLSLARYILYICVYVYV